MSTRREETEVALQEAALTLLQRDGVLAGVNLREVAEAAGVNRGLVYHYFGSRRDILRAALRRDYKRRIGEVRLGTPLPFRARWLHLFRTLVGHRRAMRIATLLHLDGDPTLRMMPIRDETQGLLEEDQRKGDLPQGIDLDALHAALNSLSVGYAIFRNRFASEQKRPVRELDEAVEHVLGRMLDGLSQQRRGEPR